MKLGRLALGLGLTAAISAVACSSPDDSARVNANVGDRATFPLVGQALARRCGSLDCHGTLYRNFRVYGYGALRLAQGDVPDDSKVASSQGLDQKLATPAESDATYDALVSLEPELTRDVLLAHGAGLDNLTLVRKGRGEERHKGNTVIVRGDNADKCLVGWLSGAPNNDACTAVLKEP